MDTKVNGRKRTSVEKPLCKYGTACYQKNKEHHKKFKHPSSDNKANVKDVNQNSTADKTSEESVIPSKKKRESKNVNQNSLNDAATADKTSEESVIPSQQKCEEMTLLLNPNANDCLIEETVDDILKSMPKDFFDFWKFCTSLNKLNPQDAFLDLGYRLVGIYDLLIKKLPKDKKVNISCHWRYFYDPPEFQTVIQKDGTDLYHIGYFRDDPSEMPSILASNSAAVNEKLTLMGDNIFCAMNIELTTIKESKTETHKSIAASKLQEQLLEFAKKKKYPLSVQTDKTRQRQNKVIAKTWNGLGIVVPVKNDVGYRPMPVTNAQLKTILKRIVTAKTELQRLEEEEALDHIKTNVHFANDEGDYGMGLELCIDLFCYGHPYLHRSITTFLPLAYTLLKRYKYGAVVRAHLKNRKKGGELGTLDV